MTTPVTLPPLPQQLRDFLDWVRDQLSQRQPDARSARSLLIREAIRQDQPLERVLEACIDADMYDKAKDRLQQTGPGVGGTPESVALLPLALLVLALGILVDECGDAIDEADEAAGGN